MTVYIVTRGCYSDYEICAVSLDRAKAERLAKVYGRPYGEAYVEAWETDTETDINVLNGRHPVVVSFNEDGSADAFGRTYDYYDFVPGVLERKNGTLRVNVYAPDEEKARRIAYDMRAQYLAEKEGIV